jgi:hypothetical protein
MTEIIVATDLLGAYTNAVLALALSAVTDFAQKLDLPERASTPAHVRRFVPYTHTVGAWVTFKDGNEYTFEYGYVHTFRSAHSFFALQNPALIPRFYGPVNMTRTQVVALARSAVRRLGLSEELLYVDLEPEIEVNSNKRRIESVYILSRALEKEPPPLPGVTATNRYAPPEVPPGEARLFTAAAMLKIAEFAKALALPLRYAPATNLVAASIVEQRSGYRLGEIRLLNGFKFTVVEGAVVGFAAPDEFFNWRQIKLKDFAGKWNITEAQAADVARWAIAAIGIPRRLVTGPPSRFDRPFGAAKDLIPRCKMQWVLEPGSQFSGVMVEVDGSSGTIKSIRLM